MAALLQRLQSAAAAATQRIAQLERQLAEAQQRNDELQAAAQSASPSQPELTAVSPPAEPPPPPPPPQPDNSAEVQQLRQQVQSLQTACDQLQEQQRANSYREGRLRTQNVQLLQTVTTVRLRLEKLSLQIEEVK